MDYQVEKNFTFRQLFLFAFNRSFKATNAAHDICAIYGGNYLEKISIFELSTLAMSGSSSYGILCVSSTIAMVRFRALITLIRRKK